MSCVKVQVGIYSLGEFYAFYIFSRNTFMCSSACVTVQGIYSLGELCACKDSTLASANCTCSIETLAQ